MRQLSSTAAVALLGLVALLQCSGVDGHLEWVQRIPNCGVARRNGVIWPALGHVTANGLPAARRDGDEEASDENQFGKDFEDIGGERWTVAFCRHDSDGDGYTNGEELGDPDCVWTETGGVPPNRTWDISHPGYADSVPTGTSPAPTPAPVTQTVAAGASAVQSPTRTLQNGAMAYSWTIALGAAAGGGDELELTMTSTGDFYVSWGVAPTLMDGPMIACYVAPAGTEALCSDWDGVGLTLGTRASRTRILSWSRQGSGFTVTVRVAMTAMRVLPGVPQRAIWATGAYTAATNTPLVHTTAHRGAEQVDLYSVVVGGTTLAPGAPAPTLPPTPAPPTAPPLEPAPGLPPAAESPHTTWGSMSFAWRVFASAPSTTQPARRQGANDTAGAHVPDPSDIIEWTLGARLGEYASVGFSPTLMDGPMVTCTVEAATARPFCSDWMGVGLILTFMPPMSHVVNASVHGGRFLVTVRQRVSTAGVVANTRQRLILAVGPYNTASNVPLQHGEGKEDRDEVVVDAYAGLVIGESKTLHIVAGVVVGVVAALWVAVGAAMNFKRIVLGPNATRVAGVLSGLLFLALVAVYTGINFAAYKRNVKGQELGRALGDGAALCLWFVVYPVPKHAGVAQLMGSSYERAVPYHLLVGVMVFLMATAHLVVMALKMADPWTELFLWRGEHPVLAGFIAWALLLVIVVSSVLPLRRYAFWLFRLLHVLYVPMFVCAGLHYPKLLWAMLPPTLNYLADLALRARSHVRAGAVVGAASFSEAGQFASVRVQLAAGAKAPGAGEFVLLSAPGAVGCAVDPHPFSVAWHDDARHEALVVVKATANPTGWTRRFCDAVAGGALAPGSRLGWLGPYGALQVPLGSARTAVLVAGGIGVTPILSILQAIREGREGGDGVERVVLLWAVRDVALVEELAPQLRACGLGHFSRPAAVYSHSEPATPEVNFVDVDDATPTNDPGVYAQTGPTHDAGLSAQTADDGSGLEIHAELFVSSADAFASLAPNTAALFDAVEQRRPDVPADAARALAAVFDRSARRVAAGIKSARRPEPLGHSTVPGEVSTTAAVYACGPEPLMDAAGAFARERNASHRTLLHTETFDM